MKILTFWNKNELSTAFRSWVILESNSRQTHDSQTNRNEIMFGNYFTLSIRHFSNLMSKLNHWCCTSKISIYIFFSEICNVNEFRCPTDGRCIDKSLRCNGYPDCPDIADEAGCRETGKFSHLLYLWIMVLGINIQYQDTLRFILYT